MTQQTTKLSVKQVELLCTLLPRPLVPKDAALQTCMTVNAASRCMNALTTKGLTNHDVPTFGAGAKYDWHVTQEGKQWVRDNRPIVEKVHKDLGFNAEELDSLYASVKVRV